MRQGALLPVIALLLAVLRAATDPETDLFWMAREGQQVLSGGGFTHPDRWSWAPVPGNFVPTSPLWELLGGLAWHLGRAGLILLTVLTLTACALGLAWVARSLGASETATATALLLCVVVEPASWTARAALPALVLLLVALTGFHRTLPRLVALPWFSAGALVAAGSLATAYLGIWLHGSWSAYVLALMIGGLWLAAPSGKRAMALAVFGGVAAMVGASCGPLGLTVWRQAGRVASTGHGVITEWTSPWALGGSALGAYAAGTVLIVFSLRALRRRALARPLLELLVAAAIAAQVVGFAAERFSFLAMSFVMPAVAVALDRGLPPRLAARLAPRLGERLHEPYWRIILTMVAAAFLPVALLLAPASYAVLDTPALASLPSGCALFSDDGTGSEVALKRPDVRPWIDGRLDYWGVRRMQTNRTLLWHSLPGTLVPAGSQCVVLPSGHYPDLAKALNASPDWLSTTRTGAMQVWVHR